MLTFELLNFPPQQYSAYVLQWILIATIIIGTYPRTPWALVQWGGLALMIAGAVVCYPFSKSLWLAADLIFRPVSVQEMEWHKRDGMTDGRESLPHL